MRSSILSTTALLSLAVTAAAQSPGSFVTNGTGCVARSNTIAELFPIGVFDLNNSAMEFLPNGMGSYIAIPSASTIAAPSGVETTLNGDDTVFTGLPLSFTFNYPGGAGSTSTVAIGSNGHIAFEGDTATRCCSGTAGQAAALTGGPSIAGFNTDLNTSIGGLGASGRIWYEEQTLSGSQVFLATWENAGEYNLPGASNNFQIQLWDNGDRIVLVWGSTTPTGGAHDVFVGWSAGGGQPAISRDLSALPIDGGNGSVNVPLTMTGTADPREGGTMTWSLTNVPASSVAGVIFVGTPAGGLPLDIIGMETCSLYSNPFVTIPATLTSPTGTASLALGAGSAGLSLETQAAIIAPGQTTLGVITSNGGTLTIGDPLPMNDECSSALVLVDGLNPGDTTGLTRSATTGSCGLMGTDGWYLYVPTCTGTTTVSFCAAGASAGHDTVLAAFDGSCGALTEIACNDDTCGLSSEISFPTTIGVPVYIAIGSFNNNAGGAFVVNVSCM